MKLNAAREHFVKKFLKRKVENFLAISSVTTKSLAYKQCELINPINFLITMKQRFKWTGPQLLKFYASACRQILPKCPILLAGGTTLVNLSRDFR